MTSTEILTAAMLWRGGKNTFDIARALGLNEAAVHNRLQEIREAAGASRRSNLRVARA